MIPLSRYVQRRHQSCDSSATIVMWCFLNKDRSCGASICSPHAVGVCSCRDGAPNGRNGKD
jgi:hypothetical protein